MEYLFESMAADLVQTVPAPNPMGDAGALTELAEALLASARPLIVTEEAGRHPPTVPLLVELAEVLAAPVVETRGSRFMNFPRNHYLHGGFDPTDFIDDADEILLCGVMAPWHPSSRRPKVASGITVMRENPLRTEVPYWGFPTDRLIAGAIEPGLTFLLDLIKGGSQHDRGERRSELQRRHASKQARIKESAIRDASTVPIRPRMAALALSSALPADAVVVDETLTSRLGLLELIDQLGSGCYFAGAIGGLGTGLGTALGVKLAAPDHVVVCTIGDGSIGYEPALAALAASREHGLPVLIVIMNNLGYLSQKATIPKYFPGGWAVAHNHFPGMHVAIPPDYVRIAEAFGGVGAVVTEPGELGSALESAFGTVQAGTLTVVDVRLQPASEIQVRLD
jgi:acetolactate synthase-1/2/3 large subunit